MIIKEYLSSDLIYHHSDTGMMIKQVETGEIYEDAVDKIPCTYTYEETDIPIEVLEEKMKEE